MKTLALFLSLCVVATGFAQTPTTSSTQTQTKPQSSASKPSPGATPEEQEDVVKITTNLVQIDAVVTKDQKPVTNLTADDFEIFEDGKRQPITSFAFISNVPSGAASGNRTSTTDKNAPPFPGKPLNPADSRRMIALVVDDLGLSAESLARVRLQLRKFITEKLDPNDLVAIIRTGGEMGALQQFTNDKRMLDRALSQVRWNPCSRVGISVFQAVSPILPSNSLGICGGFSSILKTMRSLRFVVEAMGALPGRKSMVVFSDSLPREDQEVDLRPSGLPSAAEENPTIGVADRRDYSSLLQRIAEKAIRSSVVIYTVDASGLMYTGPTAADDIRGTPAQINAQVTNLMSSRSLLLQQRREGADLIARQTGGFLVRNSNDYQLDRVLEDQSGYYLIGYRPTDETFNKTFHKIKARVKKSGMMLRTRYGFFGVSEEEAEKNKPTITDRTTLALMSPFASQEIEVELTSFFAYSKSTGSLIRSFIFMAAKDLQFNQAPEGWHNASIELRTIVFGNNGKVVDQQTLNRTISLKGNTYQQALKEGITVQFDVPVKRPGSYQFRVAARDEATSLIGSAGQFVDIPNLSNGKLAMSGIVMRGESDQDNSANPALRRFAPGASFQFVSLVYNANNNSNQSPRLAMEARLFHDDKLLLTSPEMPIEMANQKDLGQIVAPGVIRLPTNLEPGTYFLQVTLIDKLVKEKQVPVTQWIDFEVVGR